MTDQTQFDEALRDLDTLERRVSTQEQELSEQAEWIISTRSLLMDLRDFLSDIDDMEHEAEVEEYRNKLGEALIDVNKRYEFLFKLKKRFNERKYRYRRKYKDG